MREGLPDALRALVEDMPRSGWERHPEFGPLTQFWLERHLGFRKLLSVLRADTQGLLNGDLDPRDHAGRLARFGGMFLQGLQEHHGVEDHHYFPRLMELDPSMERAFALPDADHHELHEALEGLARDANAVLQGGEASPLDGRLVIMVRCRVGNLPTFTDLLPCHDIPVACLNTGDFAFLVARTSSRFACKTVIQRC